MQVRTTVYLGAALVALSGCGALRSGGGASTPQVSTDQLVATLPPEQRAAITQAEEHLRAAERDAERAQQTAQVGQERVRAAQAEADARKAAIEKAQAQVDLVEKQYQAQLSGTPTGGQAPSGASDAQRRLDDARYQVEVARWQHDQAQSLAQLRQAEQQYANAFRQTAQDLVKVRQAEVDLAKAQVASQARPEAVPGVVDPTVARAQAQVREAQADLARSRAAATEQLARVQLAQRAMARFDAGPPRPLQAAAPGRSGSAEVVAPPQALQPPALPWPQPWNPGAESQSGGGAQPPAQR